VHAKIIRPAKEAFLKDAADNWAKDAKGNAGPSKANVSGAPSAMKDVTYVVGSKWKQRYLVPNPATGGMQFLDKQWNTVHKQWEGYAGNKNDWETNCATCHVTGYKVLEVEAQSHAVKKWSYSEMNVGCEACHGPGSAHASSGNKSAIWNPATASLAEQDKACGYCHIRLENEHFKTGQGNISEHLPHPTIGQSYRPGTDDWTKWYPEGLMLVGIQPDKPVNKNYPKTDLDNAFWLDEQAQKAGLYEARKHHQQYQEHLQTAHAKKNVAGCNTCHSAHASANKPAINAREACKSCHTTPVDVEKIMVGTGRTVDNLFVRNHVFNPNQARPRTPTAPYGGPEPAFVR
jgi:predicted CXXCH cytochrome family protein